MKITDPNSVKLMADRVLLKRRKEFDNPKKVGSIYTAGNVNIRESKICEVLKVGDGNTNGHGKFWHTSVIEGNIVYCTRYGKEIVNSPYDYEGDMYIITRESGLLAFVDLDKDGNPCFIRPRMNRIWAKEVKVSEEKTKGGIIKVSDPKKKINSVFEVLEVGPGLMNLDTFDLDSMEVKKGDFFIANKGAGVQITWHHTGELQVFRLISETEVMAIVDKETRVD